jgi:uncharacterized protein (TIRG00374 family)
MRGRGRAALVWSGLAVTVVFAYLAVRDVNAGEAWRAVREANGWWLAPSGALLVVAIGLRAVRWRYLFVAETRPPLGHVTRALLIGYLFNNILPARAGEAARVVVLTQTAGVSRAESAGTVVIERAYDVLSLLVLLFVLGPWLPEVTWLTAAATLAVALGAVLAVGIVVLVVWGDRPLRALLRPLGRFSLFPAERLEEVAANLTQGLAALHRPRIAVAAFALTTVSWIVLGLSFWVAMLAFDLGLSPVAGVFVLIAIGLASILPSSPAGLGVFEAATVVALGAYGVSDSRALSYAVVLHLVNFLPYLAVGVVVLHRHAAGLRRVRNA